MDKPYLFHLLFKEEDIDKAYDKLDEITTYEWHLAND